jgi:hypothetical protein
MRDILRLLVPLALISMLTVACDENALEENSPGAAAVGTPNVAHYSNEWLKVELDYPAHWVPISGHELGGKDGKFADPHGEADGYFTVSALGGQDTWTLDQAAEQQASHKLKPFGDQPTITVLGLPAGEARLISPDPSSHDLRMAEVLIRYPAPVNEGAISQPGLIIPVYFFFVLSGDVGSIQTIAETVRLSAS